MLSGDHSAILALLPEGTFRDEGTFLLLIVLLGAFVGAAVYLRIKRRREGMKERPA